MSAFMKLNISDIGKLILTVVILSLACSCGVQKKTPYKKRGKKKIEPCDCPDQKKKRKRKLSNSHYHESFHYTFHT